MAAINLSPNDKTAGRLAVSLRAAFVASIVAVGSGAYFVGAFHAPLSRVFAGGIAALGVIALVRSVSAITHARRAAIDADAARY